ncbi:hypothetical protein M436DRAFT_44529 [Aureobasidium namibiae CBS 147.97]|uniref:Zn(2)-C6 fungal-type domain-containing protein n=1 Tax=Aureobasidium namibiae CBS 147.97 TaxID=1043004 RepID=A0A074WLT1_9PEZI
MSNIEHAIRLDGSTTQSNAKRPRIASPQSGRRVLKTTRACDACRLKKARCAGTKPCPACVKRGAVCSYDSQYMRGRPPTPPLSTLAPGVSPGLPSEGHLPVQPYDADFAPGNVGLSSRNSPELHSTDIQGQYVDPTSGLSFLERARDRFSSRRPPSDHAQDEEWSYRQQPVLQAGDKPLVLSDERSGLNTALPTGDSAIELLNVYFDVCVATYKPLHRPTLDAWHKQALQNAVAERALVHNLGYAKLSTLFAVFAVATYHNRRKTQDFSFNESDALFRESLDMTNMETGLPRLDSVQARLIQVFYLLMTCRMNQAWFTFGTVLQLVSSLGLHRRVRRPRQERDYVYRQCQKRTFWTTYILDKYFGVLMGRPQHFHDDDIDQDFPDCVNDEDMTATGFDAAEDPDDCLIEAFVENAKLARLVGTISRKLYPTKSLPASKRLELTQRLQNDIDNWHKALPAFLSTIKASSLIRSFQRQSVAIRMAHCHAVMHLHRPYLLRSAGPDAEASVKHCVTAALTVLRTADNIATSGRMFHAFWWTHYVTFCALSITYVWQIQRPRFDCGVDTEQLLKLAERCQTHLARATASNSPSRRYSIILEELRAEAGLNSTTYSTMSLVNDQTELASNTILESNPEDQSAVNNFFEGWEISDWLDLDALAYGYPAGSSPDLGCFDSVLY